MSNSETRSLPEGVVSIVGCGPGDPELLTLKAASCIRSADVLVVDRLVDPRVLALKRGDARVFDVGKKAGQRSIAQDDINRILVREALKGQRVARLKGGDGFVFGRAAEEIAAVRAAGIAVDVIPGITAAHACAASVTLPLTLRDQVRQVSLVTGATADGMLDLDWQPLPRPGHAFAIYMGVRSASVLRERLLAHGASAALPIVIVENGTRDDERAIATTLGDLIAALTTFGVRGPAIIFGGLDWKAANLSRPAKVVVYRAAPSPDTAALTPTLPARPASLDVSAEV